LLYTFVNFTRDETETKTFPDRDETETFQKWIQAVTSRPRLDAWLVCVHCSPRSYIR